MKKLGLLFKETSEIQIKNRLKESDSVFIVKYSGLSSPDITALRQSLRCANASFFVVKNSVARRALKDSGLESIVKNVDGPCGLIFSKDEPVGTSSAICTFAKDHEKLVLQVGYLQNKIFEKKDIEVIAKLPSKDVLRAQVVCTLNAPIAGLVITLNQILLKFVCCLDQIRISKEQKK